MREPCRVLPQIVQCEVVEAIRATSEMQSGMLLPCRVLLQPRAQRKAGGGS